MSVENEIRDRVKAYITDHHQWAMQHFSGNPSDPFQGIDTRAAVASKRTFLPKHCTPEWVENEIRGSGVGWPPSHDPSCEELSSVIVSSETAVVITTHTDLRGRGRKTFFDYGLSNVEGKWLISEVFPFFTDPTVPPQNQPSLAEIARWHPPQIVPDDYPDGLEKLFAGQLSVIAPDGIHKTMCKRIGEIAVTSGYLICSDLGLWEDSSFLLDLPVPLGRHPVDIVIDETSGRVVAARVVFDPTAVPIKQICATRWERPKIPKADDDHRINSHYIATDTAAIGLIDAAELLPSTRRERSSVERRLQELLLGPERKRFAVLNISDKANAVAIEKGFGDGIYPSFWLLDSEGKPVQLVFDFGILGTPVFREVQVPFNLKKHAFTPKSADLDPLKVKVKFYKEDDAPALQITGGPAVQSVKGFDSKGNLIFDGKDLDSDIDDDEKEFYLLPEDVAANTTGRLEICFFVKNRYEVQK